MTPPRHDMTLTELVRAFAHRFHPQSWYRGERFMGCYPSGLRHLPEARVYGEIPGPHDPLPRAVDLAHAFFRYPDAECWRLYWWCADKDARGQRVYVGGVCPENGHRFEIHRHLHVNDQWATPT